MDEQTIDRQVNGAWLDMFGYEIPAAEGARWSRLINEHLARTAKAEPRLLALATVPLQTASWPPRCCASARQRLQRRDDRHPAQGRRRRARRSVADTILGDRQRAWLGRLHPPGVESGDNRVHDYGMANAVGRITDTLIAVSRLIYAANHALRQTHELLSGSAARRCLTSSAGCAQLHRQQGTSSATPMRRGGALLRHHRSGPAFAAFSRRLRRRRAHHDGLGMPFPIAISRRFSRCRHWLLRSRASRHHGGSPPGCWPDRRRYA